MRAGEWESRVRHKWLKPAFAARMWREPARRGETKPREGEGRGCITGAATSLLQRSVPQ